MKRIDIFRRTLRGGLVAAAVTACVLAGTGAGRGDEDPGRRIDRSGPAAPDGRVGIELLAGSVQVEGWERDEVRVTGTLDGQAEGLHFDSGKRTRIEVDYPRSAKDVDGSHLVVHVPHGSRLEIECVSAEISVGGVRGAVEISSTAGDITVTGPCRGLEIEVVDGDVTASGLEGEVEVDCTSGEIRLDGGTGSVDIECVQGDIEVDFGRLDDLSIESVSGDARVTADLSRSGDFEITAFAGRIVLTVPGSVSARFRATTFSGDIRSDFAMKGREKSEFAPGQKRDFTVGEGGADVQLTAFSGNVEILKR